MIYFDGLIDVAIEKYLSTLNDDSAFAG